jgi:CheY-like chemotaxis protein
MHKPIAKSDTRILVVEDESVYLSLASMLNPAGYHCARAASGLEALALLESDEEFDLMITHLVIPDLDGLSLTDRTTKDYPNMPVVMVTGVPNRIHLATQHGAYDCLPKPIEARPPWHPTAVQDQCGAN